MKRFLSLLMVVILLVGTASAQMLTTGSVNVRSGPGLEYNTIGSIAEDELLVFRDLVEVDERGVEWYCIGYKNLNGWVSSKYVKSIVEPVDEVSAEKISRYKEIAQYFDAEDIDKAAKEIGLDQYYLPYGDEGPTVYYDESLVFGVKNVQYMTLTGPGYTIHGAAVGMTLEEVGAKLREAGFVGWSDEEDCTSFESPTPEGSDLELEFDSVLYISHENGIVYSVHWDAYSG